MLNKVDSIHSLKLYIALDLRARRARLGFREILNPVIRFQIVLRIYEYAINSSNKIFKLIWGVYFKRFSIRLGFSVPPNVFGPGLCLVHYGTIVINPRAKVGRNCRIHAGVNIGGKAGFYDESTARALCPVIGANCYIGPGAKIFGPVQIGNNCSIGANAVVTKSFRDQGLTLVGVPASVVDTRHN